MHNASLSLAPGWHPKIHLKQSQGDAHATSRPHRRSPSWSRALCIPCPRHCPTEGRKAGATPYVKPALATNPAFPGLAPRSHVSKLSSCAKPSRVTVPFEKRMQNTSQGKAVHMLSCSWNARGHLSAWPGPTRAAGSPGGLRPRGLRASAPPRHTRKARRGRKHMPLLGPVYAKDSFSETKPFRQNNRMAAAPDTAQEESCRSWSFSTACRNGRAAGGLALGPWLIGTEP